MRFSPSIKEIGARLFSTYSKHLAKFNHPPTSDILPRPAGITSMFRLPICTPTETHGLPACLFNFKLLHDSIISFYNVTPGRGPGAAVLALKWLSTLYCRTWGLQVQYQVVKVMKVVKLLASWKTCLLQAFWLIFHTFWLYMTWLHGLQCKSGNEVLIGS